MTNRLLDRQVSLLDYLSSAAAVFGDQPDAPVDPALQGIDRGLLRLEARFACNKRIEKIIAVFPRTLEIFGADQKLILREFAEVSRPTNIRSFANAREFYEFLLARWQCEPPKPAYLPDVAACELAMVEVRNVVEDHEKPPKQGHSYGPKPGIRRRRSVVALRCAHDIRSIFEPGLGEAVAPHRDTPLVVTLSAGIHDVRIFEVAPAVFDLLARLDDWTDPRTLGAIDDLENRIGHLAANELIERRP